MRAPARPRRRPVRAPGPATERDGPLPRTPGRRNLSGVIPPVDAAILVAHGARDPRWAEPFRRVRDELGARLSPRPVALAFLELLAPTFEDAAAALHAAGARRILVVPVFLAGGGHVAKDVPELVRGAKARFGELDFVVTGALGEEPEVLAGMVQAVARLAGR